MSDGQVKALVIAIIFNAVYTKQFSMSPDASIQVAMDITNELWSKFVQGEGDE